MNMAIFRVSESMRAVVIAESDWGYNWIQSQACESEREKREKPQSENPISDEISRQIYRGISHLANLKIPIIGAQTKPHNRFQRPFNESLLELDRTPKRAPVQAFGFEKKQLFWTEGDFSRGFQTPELCQLWKNDGHLVISWRLQPIGIGFFRPGEEWEFLPICTVPYVFKLILNVNPVVRLSKDWIWEKRFRDSEAGKNHWFRDSIWKAEFPENSTEFVRFPSRIMTLFRSRLDISAFTDQLQN